MGFSPPKAPRLIDYKFRRELADCRNLMKDDECKGCGSTKYTAYCEYCGGY